jgi:hypothetical protein
MNTYTKTILLTGILALGLPGVSLAANDPVYGWEIMSEQERMEHREKMQSMKTAEERERYRMEHHKKMEQRAKEQGVTLKEPQRKGSGMGEGRGMHEGGGMGGGGYKR